METNFSDWLRNKLNEKGWSQAELARRSGVSPAQITRVLSGERGLGEQSILAIADALRMPPEDVFKAAGLLPQTNTEDPVAKEAAYIVSRLSEERKRQVIEYLRFMADIDRPEKKSK